MPGASRFWEPRVWISKYSYWFFMFLGWSPRVTIVELFDYCVYYIYRLRKLMTLTFIVWVAQNKLNHTEPRFMTHELDQYQCIHGRPQKIFQGGTTSKFCLSVSGCWRCMQKHVHKTVYSFYPICLCWSNLNSQSFVWNALYTSAIRNAFSFHKLCLTSIFSSTFYK